MLFHAKVNRNGNIEPAFITPLIVKGDGKNTVNVNLRASDMVLPIAYTMEATILTSDKRNPAEGKTYRDNAAFILASLAKTGKPSDTFTAYLPKTSEDRTDFGNLEKFIPVAMMTRENLVKEAEVIMKCDDILTSAENEVKRIVTEAGKVEVKFLEAKPVYVEGASVGRAKKASGTVSLI